MICTMKVFLKKSYYSILVNPISGPIIIANFYFDLIGYFFSDDIDDAF